MNVIDKNIIYKFEDFRDLILQKATEGTYFLAGDEKHFEQIQRNNREITRDAYIAKDKYVHSLNVVKYVEFSVDKNYTTKEMYNLVDDLRTDTKIIITIFNPSNSMCFLMYVSNRNEDMLEEKIQGKLQRSGKI